MVAGMPVDIRDTLAANIRAEMARKGITQEQVAARLGVSQPQISRRLAGEITFDVIEISRIAELVGVTPAELLRGAS